MLKLRFESFIPHRVRWMGFITLISAELTIFIGMVSFYYGLQGNQGRREVKVQQIICQRSYGHLNKVIVVENSTEIMGRAVYGHFIMSALLAFLALFANNDPQFIYWVIFVLLIFPVWYIYFRRLNEVFIATSEGISLGTNVNFIYRDRKLIWTDWQEIDRVLLESCGKPSAIVFIRKQEDVRDGGIRASGAIGGIPNVKFQELVTLIKEKVPSERIDPRIR